MSQGFDVVSFINIFGEGSVLGEAIFGFSKGPKNAIGLVVAWLRNLIVTAPDVVEDLFDMPVAEVNANLERAVALAVDKLGQVDPQAQRITSDVLALREELAGALDFVFPQAGLPQDSLERFYDQLLNPTFEPGVACLPTAPLLRDLLDVALGRAVGGLDKTAGKVKESVLDLLLPAFGDTEFIAHSVQQILDDPITAALNLVLSKREQIDCPVEASLGEGISVIETQVRRLMGAVTEALA